jgi:hypothetical protein
MDINEIRQQVKGNVTLEIIQPKSGGQSLGIQTPKVRLYCEEIGIALEMDYYVSKLENKRYLTMLMHLAIDDLIK